MIVTSEGCFIAQTDGGICSEQCARRTSRLQRNAHSPVWFSHCPTGLPVYVDATHVAMTFQYLLINIIFINENLVNRRRISVIFKSRLGT